MRFNCGDHRLVYSVYVDVFFSIGNKELCGGRRILFNLISDPQKPFYQINETILKRLIF